jgi:predicted GNAT family acetyltransferase
MPESLETIPVVDNTAANRFEVRMGDDVAYAEYVRRGETISFTHTLVPEHLQNRGVASRIAQVALEQSRSQGLEVKAQCAFFKHYLEQEAAGRAK